MLPPLWGRGHNKGMQDINEQQFFVQVDGLGCLVYHCRFEVIECILELKRCDISATLTARPTDHRPRDTAAETQPGTGAGLPFSTHTTLHASTSVHHDTSKYQQT